MTKQLGSTVRPAQLKETEKIPDLSAGLLNDTWKKLKTAWTSSLLKLCYRELLVFLVLFKSISCIHRYILNEKQLESFKQWITFFNMYTSMISLPFLLGFYLTIVAARWWQQYLVIPWPDRLMLTLALYIGRPKDEKGKRLRSVLTRRCLLMLVLIFRHISDAVRHRFPTFQDVVEFGLMTSTEKQHLESIVTDLNLFWVPGSWVVSNLQDAVDDGTLSDSMGVKLVMEEFLDFRAKCGLLWSYYWISIPKAYNHVVTMAAYSFFTACLMGRQCVDSVDRVCHIDRSIPVWTVFEFLVYIGLLKAAEQMVCPFGDDDEDFDLNFLIDRHVKVARLHVELLTDDYPPVDETIQSSVKVTEPQRLQAATRPVIKLAKH